MWGTFFPSIVKSPDLILVRGKYNKLGRKFCYPGNSEDRDKNVCVTGEGVASSMPDAL